MLEYNDLPEEVASVVLAFKAFIQDDAGKRLSYDELIEKFEDDDSCSDNSFMINNYEDDLFDFDFGCLGGTISNIDGEAHLDCLQWYNIVDEDEEPEIEDIDINTI
jgi:hypothetical protein